MQWPRNNRGGEYHPERCYLVEMNNFHNRGEAIPSNGGGVSAGAEGGGKKLLVPVREGVRFLYEMRGRKRGVVASFQGGRWTWTSLVRFHPRRTRALPSTLIS